MTPYDAYLRAERRINEGLIRLGLSLARPEGYVRDPEARIAAMRDFIDACGNPQRNLPALHVAGTSGKGSVCAAAASILRESGLSVGLHVSPYLQSATEKIWIDGLFVDAREFDELVEWVLPAARPRLRPETPASIHGMASVAVALEAFRRAKVDCIVFEAGCGARYDLTSLVETEVAVITNVGLDHVVSLGPGIERIAWHKAGAARPGRPLVCGATLGPAAEVIRGEAREVGAELVEVPPGEDAVDHNRRLAVRAAEELAGRLGRRLDPEAVRRGLARARLAGRSEAMPSRPGSARAVLDGAHNADKLAVAVERALFAAPPGRRVALVGLLGTKAGPALARPLAGRFDAAVATRPRVYGKTPFPAAETAALLAEAGIETVVVEPRPREALERALELAGADGSVLATGSFYLAGELRERWYPKRAVVLERTSWPEEPTRSNG